MIRKELRIGEAAFEQVVKDATVIAWPVEAESMHPEKLLRQRSEAALLATSKMESKPFTGLGALKDTPANEDGTFLCVQRNGESRQPSSQSSSTAQLTYLSLPLLLVHPTGRQLQETGERLKNCAKIYISECYEKEILMVTLSESSSGKPRALAQYNLSATMQEEQSQPEVKLSQVKGPCNEDVNEATMKQFEAFLPAVEEWWGPRHERWCQAYDDWDAELIARYREREDEEYEDRDWESDDDDDDGEREWEYEDEEEEREE